MTILIGLSFIKIKNQKSKINNWIDFFLNLNILM